MSLAARLHGTIGRVAEEILGPPNHALSKPGIELRYGTNGSLRINLKLDVFEDHENGVKGGVLDFIHYKLGLANGAAVTWMEGRGIIMPEPKPVPAARQQPRKRIEAEYVYLTADGQPLFKVVRSILIDEHGKPILSNGKPKKTFSQARWTGSGWVWNMDGVQRIPYGLPALVNRLDASPVFVPEGEKKADALIGLGKRATTWAGGAGNWRMTDWSALKGEWVVLLADNDPAGEMAMVGGVDNRGKWVDGLASHLLGICKGIKYAEAPGEARPAKWDVADAVAEGMSAAEIFADIKSRWVDVTPEWLDQRKRALMLAAEVRQQAEPPANVVPIRPETPPPSGSGSPFAQDAPLFSDEALALAYATSHADAVRYVFPWGKWMTWQDTHWSADATLAAYDRVRAICRLAAKDADFYGKPTAAKGLASAKTVAGVERLARSDRRMAATVHQWDAEPWHLNTPNGILDLRSRQMLSHDPSAYHTKITAVAPSGTCPQFMQFLDTITASEDELQLFIQRVFGYSLTGLTTEHALFFGYGTGANGKSVLFNTLSAIVGSYHKTAPIETFTENPGSKHPTDLAMLQGARLVTAIETEEGRRWQEARIKTLTGGDTISARFMRQDFFEYTPQFKLLIAGNHKPGLRSVDEAIRRRLHLIPFAVTIPEVERDPELFDKLRAEWPGILQWAIDGCYAWQERGLDPPISVRQATDDYLAGEDPIAAWIDEDCVRSGSTNRTELYSSFKKYADRTGEFCPKASRFYDKLERQPGIREKVVRGNRLFDGISLKADDTLSQYGERHPDEPPF